MNPKYLHSIDELDNLVGLNPKERDEMEVVTQTFPFRANEYYLSLIDWKDGRDPLIVVPDPRELKGGGCMACAFIQVTVPDLFRSELF
jgi:L-lysine 2,3-aminomutase